VPFEATLTPAGPRRRIAVVPARCTGFALVALIVVSLAAGTARAELTPPGPVRGTAVAKAIPAFALTVPPGGKEGDRSISAHWFSVAGGRLDAGADLWVIGSFYFPQEMPLARGWGVVWNFHTVGGDVGWPIGVSPIQIDITNGLLHVLTHGGGSLASIGGVTQPVNVTNHDFPKLCPQPILRGAWTDWVMHLKLDPKHGFVKLWQRGALVVDARDIPTLYTGQQHVELWTGFYTNGERNQDQTFAMALEPPRIASSFREAVAAVPVVQSQWGALQFDPSTVSRLRSRAPSAFVYPRTFTGKKRCTAGS
jgi:hypothetical protein